MACCIAGAPFVCGSVLVFIALIVGLFIRQDEVEQSEASSALQDPFLREQSFPVTMTSIIQISISKEHPTAISLATM